MNSWKNFGFALVTAGALALSACGGDDNNTNNTANNGGGNNGTDVPATIVESGSFANVDGTPAATGMVSIREDGGKMYLYLESDFMQEMGPGDTEVRLAKDMGNLNEQIEADASSVSAAIGTVPNGASGDFLFELPSGVNASDYNYVVIWCPTAGVNFGVAMIGDGGGNNGDNNGAAMSWSGSLTNVDGTPAASGMVTITETDSGYHVALSDDFMVEMGPGDTEVRLAMGMGNAAEQLEADPSSVSDAIGTIGNGATGAQEFDITMDPSGYAYLIIWCPTAGVNFAVAALSAN